MPVAAAKVIGQTEQWFLHRGIPHFIADYSASQDVFTRAAPALTLLFLAEMLGAANLEWSAWANVLAIAGGFLVLLAIWAAVNAVRGRPRLSRPERVGAVELAVFVLAPAVLPLLFGGQLLSALVTAVANLALLVVIYLVTSYGLIPLSRWATAKTFRELGAVVRLLTRALPLLLLFVTFLFINAEVWQVAASLDGAFLGATLSLFVLLGTAFLLTRLPTEIDQLATFDDVRVVAGLCQGTPVAKLAGDLRRSQLDVPRLSRRQRGNVALVVLFSEGLQVVLVSVLIAAFFVVFGLLIVPPSIIETWTTAAVGEPVATFDVLGRSAVLTTQLLKVAAFLGAFSGLYFSVYVVTDATYRQEFFEDVVGEVRQAFGVRVVYLATLSALPAAGTPPT